MSTLEGEKMKYWFTLTFTSWVTEKNPSHLPMPILDQIVKYFPTKPHAEIPIKLELLSFETSLLQVTEEGEDEHLGGKP